MALANMRERLALHFDAEASLESRVTKDAYEVHIRMPYRTQAAELGRPARRRVTRPRCRGTAATLRATRSARIAATGGRPWLTPRCAC